MLKACKTCLVEKPLDDFYANCKAKDGRQSSCSVCDNEYKRNRYIAHKAAGKKWMRPERTAWHSMIRRCTDPEHNSYHRYGARGITVCPEWLASFDQFLKDMGERPDGTSLDRKDNEKSYSPDNCRWATAEQQQRNRRNNRILTYGGETACLTEWASRIGLKPGTLDARFRKGWSVARALSTPRLERWSTSKRE